MDGRGCGFLFAGIVIAGVGLDIKCVRMRPYTNKGEVIVDAQTIIPLPEVVDYQVKIREKKQKEREIRHFSRGTRKFDVSIGKAEYLFEVYDGELNTEQFRQKYRSEYPNDSKKRYFMNEGELFHIDGKTYAFSNQWGTTTLEAVDALKTAFPKLNISYESTRGQE